MWPEMQGAVCAWPMQCQAWAGLGRTAPAECPQPFSVSKHRGPAASVTLSPQPHLFSALQCTRLSDWSPRSPYNKYVINLYKSSFIQTLPPQSNAY